MSDVNAQPEDLPVQPWPADVPRAGVEAAWNWLSENAPNDAAGLTRRTLCNTILAYEHWKRSHATTMPGLRADTSMLVDRFALALKEKLKAAQDKYGYRDANAWVDARNVDGMREALHEHIAKGDPRDVAAFCLFLWHHGASTARPVAEGRD